MLEKYWPEADQIKACIETKAENVDVSVLQAVHEPFVLKKVNNRGESTLVRSDAEDALLAMLKQSSTPVPILGGPGTGKSHLIKILDLKLQGDPIAKKWVVRRIAKSSSLAGVLGLLLEGMAGAEFDLIRTKVNDVRDNLDVDEVAELLLVAMKMSLKRKREWAVEKIKESKERSQPINEDDSLKINVIQMHAKEKGLEALIMDVNFKERLINKEGRIWNIANQFVQGGAQSKIENNDYTFSVTDLNLEGIELDNLASNAKEYIRNQRLTTSPAKRQEVVTFLNEIVVEARQHAYKSYFQSSLGQFQDVMKEIRRALYGNTLVILVEDMTTITAIEDELLDSLLLEDTRDGESQGLCEVKSAIAVTDQWEGYKKRRNTIISRQGGIEWWIEPKPESESAIYQRVEDFCGRYLNAARYGVKDIRSYAGNKWELPSWHSTNLDEDDLLSLEAFGRSTQGHSLFPFNKASLRGLVDVHCRDSDNVSQFIPRDVLNHVLVPTIRDFKKEFVKGEFPPPNFLALLGERVDAKFKASTKLVSDLGIGLDMRLLQVVGFWGYRTQNLPDLKATMPAAIPGVFNLPELVQRFEGIFVPTPSPPVIEKPVLIHPDPDHPVTSPTDATAVDKLTEYVDEAFRKEAISQSDAALIRKELSRALIDDVYEHSGAWFGLDLNREGLNKYLKEGPRVRIKVPFNSNNLLNTIANFGSEEEFRDPAAGYSCKKFLIAIKTKEANSDSWQGVYKEYCDYKNFLGFWLSSETPNFVAKLREEGLAEAIGRAMRIATVIFPEFTSSPNTEKQNMLFKSGEEIRDLYTSSTGLLDWDTYKNGLIEDWVDTQKSWYKLVAKDRMGVNRGFINFKGVEQYLSKPDPTAKKTLEDILTEHSEVFSPLEGCNSEIEFRSVFTKMLEVVQRMTGKGLWTLESLKSTPLKDRLHKFLEEESLNRSWRTTKALLGLMQSRTEGQKNFYKHIASYERKSTEKVTKLLLDWREVEKYYLDIFIAKNASNLSTETSRLEDELINEAIELQKDMKDFLSNKAATDV